MEAAKRLGLGIIGAVMILVGIPLALYSLFYTSADLSSDAWYDDLFRSLGLGVSAAKWAAGAVSICLFGAGVSAMGYAFQSEDASR